MTMPQTTATIGFEQLSKYFHLPINDVAKELGICATMLKKICRRNGIPRWPHRKIKSLNKMIDNLESTIQNGSTTEADDCVKQEIAILKSKKILIMKNPAILAHTGASKRNSVIASTNSSSSSSSSSSSNDENKMAMKKQVKEENNNNSSSSNTQLTTIPHPQQQQQQHHHHQQQQHHHHQQHQLQQQQNHHQSNHLSLLSSNNINNNNNQNNNQNNQNSNQNNNQNSMGHMGHHGHHVHHEMITGGNNKSAIQFAHSPQQSTTNFSINQLLTPSNNFSNAPLTSYLLGEEDDLPGPHQHEQQYQLHNGSIYTTSAPQTHNVAPPPPPPREIEVQPWYPGTLSYVAAPTMFSSAMQGHEYAPYTLPKINLPDISQQMMQQQGAYQLTQGPPHPTQYQTHQNPQGSTKVVYRTPYVQPQSMISHQVAQNNLRWVVEHDKSINHRK